METKTCSYCGGEIMKTAKKCKHCGKWLDDIPNQISTSESVKKNTISDVEIKHSNSKKILWFILAAAIIAIVIWIISVEHEKAEWEQYLKDNHVIGCIMKDANSFDIQLLTDVNTES